MLASSEPGGASKPERASVVASSARRSSPPRSFGFSTNSTIRPVAVDPQDAEARRLVARDRLDRDRQVGLALAVALRRTPSMFIR